MIKITLSQLEAHLKDNGTPNASIQGFLLVGSEPYLQYEAERQVRTSLQRLGMTKHDIFTITNHTDWNLIYDCVQSLNLFSEKTTLILRFGDTLLSSTIAQKLHELTSLLTPEVTLLVVLNKISKAQENSSWITAIPGAILWIHCHPLDKQQLPIWLNQHAQKMGLTLDKNAVELLCYYYEGNLLALTQLLEQLTLLYPDKKIMSNQIENNINDCALFSPYHWLDAILSQKIKRAMHILQQLKIKDNEPLILLRILQKELFLLINLKKAAENQTLKLVFDQFNVWQSRRNLLSNALHQLKLETLYDALNELTEIELSLKRDYDVAVWAALENLSLLLLGKIE